MYILFYGKCLKDSKNDYVIWLQSDKNDTGKLMKSIYMVEITTSGILEKKIMESDLQYKKILSSLNKKSKELKGLELMTEP